MRYCRRWCVLRDKIEAFDTVAGVYDGWYDHPQGKQVFEAEKKAVEQMIPRTGLGVEIGAGTGVFAESLTNIDRTILCLDPSVEMIKKAKKRKLPCLRGVGVPLPIRRDLLDFGYMVTVLEFLNDQVALFKEIKYNSKKNAELTILFINSDSTWGELYRNIGEKGDPIFKHATLFSLEQVSALFDKSGYSILDAKGTLNSDPANQEVDDRLIEPSSKSGVIIVKAI